MNPPSALHGAMSRDRKPFTYTPGGLDLSEIKSERMAARLMRNAMNQGVPELPPQHHIQSPPMPSTPIVVPNFNCLPVQVFPTFNLPANPKSLLRTRSNPGQPREPPLQRVVPPQTSSQFLNNSRTTGTTQYDSFNKHSATYSQINNRPVSMFEYGAPANAMNYGSDGYTAAFPDIKYDAEYIQMPKHNINNIIKSVAPPVQVYKNQNILKLEPTNEKNMHRPFESYEKYPRYIENPFITPIENKEFVAENVYEGKFDKHSATSIEALEKDNNKLKPEIENKEIVLDVQEEVSSKTTSNSEIITQQPIQDLNGDKEKKEVKVVQKHLIKKENEVEEQNGSGQQNGNTEVEAVIKLPSKKSAAKTETKVEVFKTTLPDGSIEEVKKTTTKTTVDGRTETRTRTETTIIPKDDEDGDVEEVEEEEEETGEGQKPEEVVKETFVVKKTEEDEKLKENGQENIIKTEEKSETTTTTSKKITVIQDDPGELNKEEEEEEEEEVEEVKSVTVVSKKPEEKPEAEELVEEAQDEGEEEVEEVESEEDKEQEETVGIVEEPAETKVIVKEILKEEEEEQETETDKSNIEAQKLTIEEKKQQSQVIESQSKEKDIQPEETEQAPQEIEKQSKEIESPSEELKTHTEKIENESKEEKDEEVEEEDEYQEAEEQESTDKKIDISKEPDDKKDDESKEDVKEETVQEKISTDKIKASPSKEEQNVEENDEKQEQLQEVTEEKQEIIVEREELKQEKQNIPEENLEPKVIKIEIQEQKVPLREPSVPLEKVEDVEIKPIGAGDFITKTHTENTEIITNVTEKPTGLLTEFNRIENIVTVNRTIKTLDQSYDLLQQGAPIAKTYFSPQTDKIAPRATSPYQPAYKPQQPTERRHSLLLERLSVERQMPAEIYQNTYQQSNQNIEQQRQWTQEPQAEVLTVSNVKPSQITNQQWYQQRESTNVFNNATPSPQPAAPSWTQPKPQVQPIYQPQPQYRAPTPQPQVHSQPQPEPQYLPSYTENIHESQSNSYQTTYSSHTPKSANRSASNTRAVSPMPTIVTSNQQNQYSYLNMDSSDSYPKTTQHYTSSSYVPPPWEQDSTYVAPDVPQNFYQPPQTNTYTSVPAQSWKPPPPVNKFTKPAPSSFIPPKPNQSFVAPVTSVEPPKLPGRKTYYSEYERRYISVPEFTYVPGETKFQPQPDPSPKYYYDNNEPVETVEPQWRKELREFTEKTQTQSETNVKPPWEQEQLSKAQESQTPTWSQTVRPQSWREKSFESEFVSQEWPKSNTLGRGRPLTSHSKEMVSERIRGVSVDRYNPNSYQAPLAAEHPPVQTHTHIAPAPLASGYHNPNVPAYHTRASAEPREHVSYQQPRPREARASPFQSRSFKYLQWITGTDN